MVDFRNGQRNALAFGDPVSLLAGAAPVVVNLRLTDRYGNPVPAALTAEVLAPAGAPSGGGWMRAWTPAQRCDGGEAMDGGAAADAAQPGGADSGALMDVQTPSNDAAPADAGAAADATAGLDAGGEADAEPTVRLAVGTDCEQAPVLSAQAMPDAQGRLRLCLWGTGVIGAGRVAIRVPGVLRVDDGEGGEGEALTLPTNTLPSGRVRLSVQRQPQPRCAAGEVTNALVVQVIDTAEPPNPVPGQEVRTSSAGLSGVVPEVAFSGADGRLTLRGQCPARRRGAAAELVLGERSIAGAQL